MAIQIGHHKNGICLILGWPKCVPLTFVSQDASGKGGSKVQNSFILYLLLRDCWCKGPISVLKSG